MIINVSFRHMRTNHRLENYIYRKCSTANLLLSSLNRLDVILDYQQGRANEFDRYDCHLIGHLDGRKPINIYRHQETAGQAIGTAFVTLYQSLRKVHDKATKQKQHINLNQWEKSYVGLVDQSGQQAS